MTLTSSLRIAALLSLVAATVLNYHVDARVLDGSTSRIQRMLRHIITLRPISDTFSKTEGFVEIPDSTGQGVVGGFHQIFEPAPSPVPAPPAPSPLTNVTCPPLPTECDFYFNNSLNAVPVFNISGAADSPISSAILTSVQGSSIQVYVFNTANAEYICQTPAPPPDSQFYANGVYVQARVFQGGPLSYANRYVRLNFTSVELNAFGVVINLNPGQGGNFFPEDRRCVIFQTTV